MVEGICKHLGYAQGTLYEKLKAMAADGRVSLQVTDEAHEVRAMGNDAAHGDLPVQVVREDVEDCLGFMDDVLYDVLQRPARPAARKVKRTPSPGRGEA